MSLDNLTTMKTLTKEEVRLRLGIALSTLNYKIDPKSPWHDPSFPKKIMIGPRAVRFSEMELNAWIEQRSIAPPDHSTARMQDPIVAGAAPPASAIQRSGRGGEQTESRADPLGGEIEPPNSKESRSARRVEVKGAPDSFENEMTEPDSYVHKVPTVAMPAVTPQDLRIDSPPPISIGYLSRVVQDRSNQVVLHPAWPSELRGLLERIAGSGSTVSQSRAFSYTEVLGLLNPSEAVAALLDEIDLDSYNTHRVLLTAVLYDAPRQCNRLVRIANTVGIHDPAPELLRLQREKLFAQYEPRESRAFGGVPTWAQFGDRSRIVRAWTNL